MGGCSAINCSSHSKKKHRMFKFPADPIRRMKWAINCRRGNWVPGPFAVLCSAHFEESQFEQKRQDGWKKLKQTAVPTLFDVPNPPERLNPKRVEDFGNPIHESSMETCTNRKLSMNSSWAHWKNLRKRKSSVQEEESYIDHSLHSQTTTNTTTTPIIQKLNSTPTTLLATPQVKIKSDEYEAVGMNVTAKLRKMSATQQIFAEFLIVKILTKGMLEKLSKDTDIITVTNYHEYNHSFNNWLICSSLNSTDHEDVSNCEVQSNK